jgi:PIN domain nuclease of toxin-antitoxin system
MTAAPILLDTCAAIWLMAGAAMARPALAAIDRSQDSEAGVHVSPISAWEVGLLLSKRRITLAMPAEEWFDTLLGMPGVRLANMPPKVLLVSSFLPGDAPSDPADRIVAATAREYGMTVITRDRALTAYAKGGHIDLIPC